MDPDNPAGHSIARQVALALTWKGDSATFLAGYIFGRLDAEDPGAEQAARETCMLLGLTRKIARDAVRVAASTRTIWKQGLQDAARRR